MKRRPLIIDMTDQGKYDALYGQGGNDMPEADNTNPEFPDTMSSLLQCCDLEGGSRDGCGDVDHEQFSGSSVPEHLLPDEWKQIATEHVDAATLLCWVITDGELLSQPDNYGEEGRDQQWITAVCYGRSGRVIARRTIMGDAAHRIALG